MTPADSRFQMPARFPSRRWKPRLTPAQLQAAIKQFNDLAQWTYLKFAEGEREKIIRWFKSYTELINVSTLTTPAHRVQIQSQIATDETIRDYLLELSFAFYAHGGDSDDFEERLVNSLAEGLRFDGRARDLSELPQEVLIMGPLVNFPMTDPTLRLRLSNLALRVLRALHLVKDPELEVSLSEYLLSNRHMQMLMLAQLADDLVKPSQE